MTAKRQPTAEQTLILEAVKERHPVLVIEAGAGTGKTTTLRMIADVLNDDGQYTAFNSSLVTESKEKFQGTKVSCNTTHSLAFRSEGKRFSKRLNGQRVRSTQIAEILGISYMKIDLGKDANGKDQEKNLSAGYLASQVMQAIKRYCQSADKVIGLHHFKYIDGIDYPPGAMTNNQKVREYLLPFAEAAWKDLSSVKGNLPFNHDVYVKVWQLNKPAIFGSYVLLDEAQDTAPVMLDVLKQQKIPVILVGDSAQQIYEWRGATNALAAFENAPTLYLSQSFRFGEVIANVANAVLATLQEPTKLRLKGLPTIPSKIASGEKVDVVLTRTNAVAVTTLLEAIKAGKKPHLIGGGSDVIAFVEAAASLQQGKPTSHPDLACFSSWEEVQEYAKLDEGEDLKLMVKLVDTFKAETIIGALKGMSDEKGADLTICTAHKSKGREWNSVKLTSDFPSLSKSSDSDKRLLYVAVTRAKLTLDISSCPFFVGQDALDIGEAIASAVIVEPSPEEEKAAEAQEQAAKAQEKAQEVEPFTWNQKDGKWLVRGPKGYAGQTVSVVKKNGSSQRKLLGKVVTEFSTVALYEV